MNDDARRTVASYCRICAASCGILVRVAGERVVEVRGDPDHPISRGYTCPKGRALPLLHHHPDRLDRPRIRGVERSWRATLGDLADACTTIRARHGADAIGAYLGTGLAYDAAGWHAASGWLTALGSARLYTPATVDNAPVLRAAEIVAGHPQANPVCDFERTRLLVIVGSNPVVSHGYGTAMSDPITRLRSVRARGGTIWVVDPRRTETAAVADHHLATRPGSDATLLAWLVREVLAAPLVGDAAAATEPEDRERLRAAVAWATRERAVRATGATHTELVDLAAALRTAHGGVALWCGTGVTMGRFGLEAELLRWALLALTGSLDTADGMHFHRGCFAALRRPRRAPTPRPGPASRPELASRFGQHPCVSLVDEIEAGNLRALVVVGANPLTAFPEPDRTAVALASLDVLAVADVAESPLVELATHVLPVAAQLERPDLPLHEPVAVAAGTTYTPAVVALGGDRRAAWWVFARLAQLVDATELFGDDPDRLDANDVLRRITARGAIDFDALVAAGPHGVTHGGEIGWVRAELLDGAPWRIADAVLLAGLHGLGVDGATAPALVMTPRRRPDANNSVGDPRHTGGAPPAVLVHPDDARARGIDDGGRVRIRSAHGEVDATVRHDPSLRPGVVSMAHGDPRCNPGALTSSHAGIDPRTGMPRLSGVAVELVHDHPGHR